MPLYADDTHVFIFALLISPVSRAQMGMLLMITCVLRTIPQIHETEMEAGKGQAPPVPAYARLTSI